VAYFFGFNFRSTAGFVTDPAGTGPDLGAAYPTAVTVNGIATSIGWDANRTGSSRDRNAGIDARLAGVNQTGTGAVATWRVNLPQAGTTRVRLGIGDAGSGNLHSVDIVDSDGTTVLISIRNGFQAGTYSDAAGTVHASAAAWVSSNAGVEVSFSGTAAFLRLPGTGNSDVIAHVSFEGVDPPFNTTGTGPRTVPILGGGPIGAGSVESWVRGTDTGGGGAPSFSFSGSGGLQFAGAAGAAQSTNYTFQGAGGLLFAGAATSLESNDYVMVSSGGLLFGGDAAETFTFSFSAASSGGLLFAGAATTQLDVGFAATGSGGLQLGGQATAAFTRAFAATGSGGLQLGGQATATESNDYFASGAGGLLFAGAATTQLDVGFAATGSGGLQLGGTATTTRSYNYTFSPSGGLLFSGAALAETGGGDTPTGAGWLRRRRR
jgi:hypothetical protein